MVGKLGLAGRPGAAAISRTDHREQRLAAEKAALKSAPAAGAEANADVYPLIEIGEVVGCAQVQERARAGRLKGFEVRDQDFLRDRAGSRDHQPVLGPPRARLERVGQEAEADLNLGRKGEPGCAQRHRSPLSLEQELAEPLLQRLDRMADRARRQVELRRGLGEARMTRSRLERGNRSQRRRANRHVATRLPNL